ncbi:SDR family NAD(P)-dependent oxidoreductase [Pseudactinotalea sp. HY160]|uniref:SDR family NAD(P)-dependent oxidoreductase n=1 Tax=Pseudactinotalea sp. HY160 TaxID=2654490 RepID=UPI00128E35E6|nr:SDR family oxidoreductase [Pseudactinotalea sp. HY160]MPV50718.1 SDR family NAD(P)-dependent oxidoreductase [Pseudactinotalea sp. HY160]
MSRTALVTGASRGIGLETVRRLVQAPGETTTVVMFARESEDFTAAVAELESANPHGKRIVACRVDVGDRAALQQAISDAYREVGTIHTLVNNAGYTNPVPLQQVDFADFERTMAVNLYGPFTLVQDLLHLGNQFDLIVNVASTAGITGRSGWLTYSASKAAVINMSQVMREELAIYGTRVVCISPGRTATALRRVLAPDEDPGTIMQPGHVAQVIEMLASPVGRFVDSENLVVRQ